MLFAWLLFWLWLLALGAWLDHKKVLVRELGALVGVLLQLFGFGALMLAL